MHCIFLCIIVGGLYHYTIRIWHFIKMSRSSLLRSKKEKKKKRKHRNHKHDDDDATEGVELEEAIERKEKDYEKKDKKISTSDISLHNFNASSCSIQTLSSSDATSQVASRLATHASASPRCIKQLSFEAI